MKKGIKTLIIVVVVLMVLGVSNVAFAAHQAGYNGTCRYNFWTDSTVSNPYGGEISWDDNEDMHYNNMSNPYYNSRMYRASDLAAAADNMRIFIYDGDTKPIYPDFYNSTGAFKQNFVNELSYVPDCTLWTKGIYGIDSTD